MNYLHFFCSFPTLAIFRYDLNNVIADIGGYLGLLLGASILSIYNYLYDFCKSRLSKAFKVNGGEIN